jgi:hypothetical protein
MPRIIWSKCLLIQYNFNTILFIMILQRMKVQEA